MTATQPPIHDGKVLNGLRILVVEDTFLVADSISSALQLRGCLVVGPVPRVQPALELARTEVIEGAILDVNLAGELSFPVADALIERHIPLFLPHRL
jgi:DNA-binding response OmpR family regulator